MIIVEIKPEHGTRGGERIRAALHGFAGDRHRIVAVCQPLDRTYLFEVEIHRIVMPEVRT